MDGSVDLSFESFEDINNIPSTQGMGWLASELKQEDWTVALNTSAIKEINTMVNQIRRNPLPTLLLTPEQFDIPELKIAYEKAKTICDHGAGFAVIDKLPIDDFDIEDTLIRFGAEKEDEVWDFFDAKTLVLWCNGPWCGQSPAAIRGLIQIGYPAEKLLYYRGGLQSWLMLGFNIVIPDKN